MAVTPLTDLQDWQLVDDDQDIRGKRLVDMTGKFLGTIEQMMVNTEAERVDSVRTETGELYPVGALEIRDADVVFHGVKSTGPTTANVTEDRYRIRRRTL
jgi:sporulation protein YlmC with PRC-barrel domain